MGYEYLYNCSMGDYIVEERVCENCKNWECSLGEEPCSSCWIPDKNNPDPRDNQNWKSKEVLRTVAELEESIEAILTKEEDLEVPRWMKNNE